MTLTVSKNLPTGDPITTSTPPKTESPVQEYNNSDLENVMPKFDIKFEDLVRGQTPEDIEQRCFDLCKTYIGGSWDQAQSTKDVTVTRISGGLTNQLYLVQLNESILSVKNAIYEEEPREVAIKLYQEKHMKNYGKEEAERLNDNIILTIVSEAGIGPKVYGIFHDGVIMEYKKHEQFRAKHQRDLALCQELATVLAQIHRFKVPILKASNLMLKDLQSGIEMAYPEYGIQALIEELKLSTFLKKDLRDEYRDLLKYAEQVGGPTVFCHHDFRGGNILVTEPGEKISIVDLEYCGYGPRGYDLGTLFSEWGKENIMDMPPYLIAPDEEFKRFCQLYIDASEKLEPGYSSKPENSLAQLVKETKFYYLVQVMFFLAIMIKQKDSVIPSMPFDRKEQMKILEIIYVRYNSVKELLIKDGTLQRID